MNKEDVIIRIGFFRNRAHMSARELSLQIGKHEGYINKLESHDFNLPTDVLLQIIDALQVTPEEFFAENYATFQQDSVLRSLIKNLPLEKRESLINFLKK